jgi:hypothetical protein
MCPHLAEWRQARWISASHGIDLVLHNNARDETKVNSHRTDLYLQLKLNLSAHLARGKEARKILIESNGLASHMHAYISHGQACIFSPEEKKQEKYYLVSKRKTRKDGTWLDALV